ncbi:MAG: MerR family transcriptional regulator [Myxococcales bacterium]|nr:MerR family transcriptional regulator [Myxococcales bacterium]
MGAQQPPDKLFFKIGEVSEIVGVKPHVLRYWESEFRQLRPMKTRGSHRIYKRRDVELATLIRRLLHDEGFTIPGARKKLKEFRAETEQEQEPPAPQQEASREANLRADLLAIRADLSESLKEIEALCAGNRAEEHRATVEQVVQSPAVARR